MSGNVLVPTDRWVDMYGCPDGALDALDRVNHIYGGEFRRIGTPKMEHFATGTALLAAFGYDNVEQNYPHLLDGFIANGYGSNLEIYEALCRGYLYHDYPEDKPEDDHDVEFEKGGLNSYEIDGVYIMSSNGLDYDTEYMPRILTTDHLAPRAKKKVDNTSNRRVSPMGVAVLLESPKKALKQAWQWVEFEAALEAVEPTPVDRKADVHDTVGDLLAKASRLALEFSAEFAEFELEKILEKSRRDLN